MLSRISTVLAVVLFVVFSTGVALLLFALWH